MGVWNPDVLRRARRRYEAEHGDITLEQIGEKVAGVLSEKAPSVAVLSLIFRKGREPRLSLGVALARVLDADPFEIGLARAASQPLDEKKRPPVRRRRGVVVRGGKRKREA